MPDRKASQKTQNFKADRQQQEKTTSGSTAVSQEEESGATVGSGSLKLDTWRLDKHRLVFSSLELSSFNESVSTVL